MRTMSLFLISTALCFEGGVASARPATEGPLATPDSGAAADTHKTPAKRKPPIHAHRQARAAAATNLPTESDKAARPIAHRDPSGLNDPVDFGMKWNGSNDDARGTRVQNYGGGATGSGAEVGMKLHF